MNTLLNEKMPHLMNGLDVDFLTATIGAIKEKPSRALTHWKVTSSWMGQTATKAEVHGYTIGDKQVSRPFTMLVDEPIELGGANRHPNPQEYLLAGLNACMTVGYAAVCALKGIELESLQITTEGDIDLRGFLGIDASVKPGYESLRSTVKIKAKATAQELEEVHAIVMRTSPNFFNISQAIPLSAALEIQE